MNLDREACWESLAPWLTGVEVGLGEVPTELPGASATGVMWQAGPGRFLLSVPGVARYLVEEGLRITVTPCCAERPRIISLLRMTPLAALLYQRGFLPLHGAAATCESGAVVIAGASSSGKSALLAALLADGWRLLADDLAIVGQADGGPVVWPTFGQVALWPDAAEALGYGEPVGRWASGRGIFDRGDLLATAAAPLRAILLLGEAGDGDPVRRLGGGDALRALSVLSYNNHVAEAVLGPMPFMLATARLAGLAPVVRLARPPGAWHMDGLVAEVNREVGRG